MFLPEEVIVRALSADGEILANRETALKWNRLDWEKNGGSEQCPGPMRADSIEAEA
ncbi:hypothetical protein IWX62_000880 [Arthrobacter sp. CAN_A1]